MNSSERWDREASINPADKVAELDRQLKDIGDEKKRRTLNRIESFFPDSGPLRRELYPKHLEFFRAGKYYRSRLFSAGNRCICPWTPLETDHGERLALEVLGEKGFGVQSWDGSSQCTRQASNVFLRGIEPAFLLLTDSGQEFACSSRHLVLTSEGWISVGQLIRRAGGLSFSHTSAGYLASYGADDRPGDARLLWDRGTGREPLPSIGCARSPRQYPTWPVGATEPKWPRSRASQAGDHHSNPDDPGQIADLCDLFGYSFSCSLAQWPTRLRRDVLQFARESCPLRQGEAGHYGRNSWARFSKSGFHAFCNTKSSLRSWHPDVQRFGPLEVLETSGKEFLDDASRIGMFVPWHPFLLAGNTSIVALIGVGFQPIIDFHVAGTKCYASQGLINHNCGKTVAGAYEMALHLTGNYVPWWEGRVFDEPISAWACGTTNETTKNILQVELLGRLEKDSSVSDDLIGMGTGMIPQHLIAGVEFHPQIRGAIKSCWIRHKSGKRSNLQFKSFEAGREAFEGTAMHVIHLDESPGLDIYTECLMRTFTTGGLVYITATPLNGLTELVQQFMPDGVIPETQVPV